MNKTPPPARNADFLRNEIARIADIEGEIDFQSLKARVKFDDAIISPDFLAPGPQGQEHHLLNTWLGLFAANPPVAYGMHPEGIDYIDWGNKNRRNRIRLLFVKAKKISVQPRQRIAEPSEENNSFVRLLQFVINKSRIFDHEAAAILEIDKMTLSRYFAGALPMSQGRIEAIIPLLEKDHSGPKRISAYAEYRQQFQGFLIPDPPEVCSFSDLLNHLIIKSQLPYGTAARLLEVGRNALRQILSGSVTQSRMQNILAILEIDHTGTKIFSAYEQYRERFRFFERATETFEQLVGCVIAESGQSVAAAARYFGTSYEGLKRNLSGEKMRPLTSQVVFDRLEEDFKEDKQFSAYEKYRPKILAIRRTNASNDKFHLVLGRTISESHRSIAFAAKRFGMPARTLQANLQGINDFTRESAQRIIAVLEADYAGPKEFSAYRKYWNELACLTSGLRTYSETRMDAAKTRASRSAGKSSGSEPSGM